ncbi:MAG: alpha/beta hydrolase [Micrococcales bacterium]|nr:alpha/beta hydrolase [Micrococcales bacterium]
MGRTALARVSLVACVALVAAGCASDDKPDPDVTAAPPGLEKYYSQTLEWVECSDDEAFSTGSAMMDKQFKLDRLECAWLTVPMDYADPAGEEIAIAVARAVGKNSQGSLVINPGGPGGSGVEFVGPLMDAASKTLRDSLDIVGFDPRGVGRSAPVDCLDDADMDVRLARAEGLLVEVDLDLEKALADQAEYAQACLDNTGPVLGHVDTISAARDMDVLRAALREPTLTYLGVSYGTQLGATYANLFPERAGRMVLDSAVDPTVTGSARAMIQARGFESALRAYIEDCQAGEDCPLSGSVDDGMAQMVELLEQIRENPLETGTDQVVTESLAFTGIIAALYSQKAWGYLTMALEGATEGDGLVLLILASSYIQRDQDGFYYSNMTEANGAINCADARDDIDPAAMAAEAERLKEEAPFLGQYFAYTSIGCAAWPTPAVEPLGSFAAEGAPPIVVIGITNDPATPYEWAQALAKLLSSGVLVTLEGEGHGAYVTGNSCVQEAVDGFLIDGKVPEDGLTCR